MKEAHGVGDGTAALDRVLELVAVLQTDTVRSLARNGLTPARAHVLWKLQHRGPLPQRALAEALRVSARNVTGLVDALEETGFVTREPHPTDRRTTLVSFTEAGARTAAALERDHAEFAGLLWYVAESVPLGVPPAARAGREGVLVRRCGDPGAVGFHRGLGHRGAVLHLLL